MDAGENLPKRALACAVLADQGVTGSPLNGETHIVQRHDAGEAFFRCR
jgi:hypothetical protein